MPDAGSIERNLKRLPGIGAGWVVRLNDESNTELSCEDWTTERGMPSFRIHTKGGDVQTWGCFTTAILRGLIMGGADLLMPKEASGPLSVHSEDRR